MYYKYIKSKNISSPLASLSVNPVLFSEVNAVDKILFILPKNFKIKNFKITWVSLFSSLNLEYTVGRTFLTLY